MKTLILFASRYGATEEIAYMLKSAVGGDVTLCNVRDRGVSLEGYDTVIIGSCVYMFKLDKHIKRFLRRNEKALLARNSGCICAAIPRPVRRAISSTSSRPRCWSTRRRRISSAARCSMRR